MGKQIGQKNNMRTPEEKEKIVLEHLNNHASLTELANKYSTTRGLIRQWKIKYLKEGFEGYLSKPFEPAKFDSTIMKHLKTE